MKLRLAPLAIVLFTSLQTALAQPVITATFSPLSDGQTVATLSSVGGTVTNTAGFAVTVAFRIREVDINGGSGRWWNGTNFQDSMFALAATVSKTNWAPSAGLKLPQLNSGQSYELAVTASDTNNNVGGDSITVQAPITVLTWDPGQTAQGTVVLANPNTNGGNYWFQISPQTPSVGAWRTALNVQSGEADVYMNQSYAPNLFGASFSSARTGSDGFVLDAAQFEPGQTWYILVHATPNAKWNLVSGDVFVHNLGILANDAASSTNATIGAEGMIFYRTVVPSTAPAWQIWLSGSNNMLYVRRSTVPTSYSSDLSKSGQMLVVPPYLSGDVNESYFVSVSGDPGTVIQLDSRQQAVLDIPFNSINNIIVKSTNRPYVTYRVQVPVQQIAWQLSLTPTIGSPNLAVRRGLVPNEYRNDAYSEPAQSVGASVTLVPPPPDSGTGVPGLSDGTFFVTVYGTGAYSCSFNNANPVITPVPYVFGVTNEDVARSGWRYYALTNINEQLGSLGWQLQLSNQAPGTVLAIRRNAVPGQWNFRNYDNYLYTSAAGYVDKASSYGLLQDPGHQADIWYIGVYTPDDALRNFALHGDLLTGRPVDFDGGITNIAVQQPGEWGFFKFVIPSDTMGWDLRLVNITGSPRFVVCRDTLPVDLNTSIGWSPDYWNFSGGTNWPSGLQCADGDWTGSSYYRIPVLAMGMGNPLQPGTYYVGVQDPINVCGFTLQSRGIGVTSQSIRIKDLAFTGSVTNLSLQSGEADYYRIVVPAGVPNFKLHLSALTGELLLKVQQQYLPNSRYVSPYGRVRAGYGGQLAMKPGNEEFMLLPQNSGEFAEGLTLTPGTNYVAVVSQGVSFPDGTYYDTPGGGWGAGTTSYVLSSGSEPVTSLPNTLSYGNDLQLTASQAGGTMKFYQFNVPTGIASIEVRLENRSGNPVMYLNNGSNLVGTWWENWGPYWPYQSAYGNFGGTNFQSRLYNGCQSDLITVVNPAAGPYSLSIFSSGNNDEVVLDASYRIRVRAVPPPVVAFDSGAYDVTNQPAGTWQFFQVTVPADAAGWDIRLVNVTNGSPKMVVCRDSLPNGLNSSTGWSPDYWNAYDATNWPGGLQWLNTDWTGCGVIPMLAMGMGNPLTPGVYFIAVSDPYSDSAYTIQSRGIGVNKYAIRVNDLSFAGSTGSRTLAAGEGDYYRVVVPENAINWKLHLSADSGEVLMKIQRDYLPNSGSGRSYGNVQATRGGQLLMKAGDEESILLPRNDYDTHEGLYLTPGTNYVLVVSQGQNITNADCNGTGSGWGSDTATYTLTSGTEPVVMLPDTLKYGSDIQVDAAQFGGAMKFFQFNVPQGVASIEVRLENREGNPIMYLNSGPNLVGTWWENWGSGWSYDNGYGNFGGTNFQTRSYFGNNSSLITVVNPVPGVYGLSTFAASTNGYELNDASYTVRIRAVPPPEVAFDNGTYSVTNQPARTWRFFQVTVPDDAAGWDIRLVNISNGTPQMVVCRDSLPSGLSSSAGWTPDYWNAYDATNWSSGFQWLNNEWTGVGSIPMLAMGAGNPLVPGTYFIGVKDTDHDSAYTIQSRGIGVNKYAIRIKDLAFAGTTGTKSLAAGEADYYRVVIPAGVPNWKLHLSAVTGELLMKVQQDYVPNSGIGSGYGNVAGSRGGQRLMKPGDEQFVLIPQNNGSVQEGLSLSPGAYYVAVISQGRNLTNRDANGAGSGWGSGNADYILTSGSEAVTVLPNTLVPGGELALTNTMSGGEMKFYQFTVPAGAPSLEVRIENRVGNPVMYLNKGPAIVGTWWSSWGPGWSCDNGYGNYGGTNFQSDAYSGHDASIITIPNVVSGLYSLSIYDSTVSGEFIDSTCVLRVRAPVVPQVSASAELNSSSVSNVASGLLADNQRAFYKVTIPSTVAGAPVLGWKLDLTALNGTPNVRVRQNSLPDDNYFGGSSPFNPVTATIVPPYLTPGTWYVEVKGSGSTDYTLTSQIITTNTLAHPLWGMPGTGSTNVAKGLTLPLIGDSGVNASGAVLPGDQGIDLKQGQFDYYAVVVPTNNAGLVHTVLQAISGNPDLYIRTGDLPTLAHDPSGRGGAIYERTLTGSTTEYGSWVPLHGRFETNLTSGVWYLAVHASGYANIRYRLLISSGNSVTNGLVQDLALNGGACTNQNLNGGDWRYYRVQIPDPAPTNWTINFSRTLGSARMFIRDTVPPGDGNRTSPGSYANETYNPGPWYDWQTHDLETWAGDWKNQGPYPRFDVAGAYTLAMPSLRPGTVYYLGFWSPVDSTFSVSSSASAATAGVTNMLAFDNGTIDTTLAAHGVLYYRLDVPSWATRILFTVSNSVNVGFTMEQGTLAQPGGPAHWSSGGRSGFTFNQLLNDPNNWPWLAGRSYYLAFTNTSSSAERFTLAMGTPVDLSMIAFAAPTSVSSRNPYPQIEVIWGVTNRGPATTYGWWSDAVWFTQSGILDSQSLNIGNTWSYDAIPAHGVYWKTNTVTLPMTNSGPYRLFAQADVNNAMFEATFANKISSPVSGYFTLVTQPFAFNASGVRWTPSGLQLQVDGLVGGSVVVYQSSDLTGWTPIYTNPPASGSIQFIAPGSATAPFMFYKAVGSK